MSEKSRKEKVVRNVGAQMIAALAQAILGFVSRKVFLVFLTADLLGLNSLMTSIIGMLSIAELGVGEAINFSLYKPLAEDDREQVNAIMRLYRKLYLGIAFLIAALGIVLLPFLKHFIGSDITVDMPYVYLVYGLFVFDCFLSYCLAYSRNIISADQCDYIVTNVDTISQLVTTSLQIALLWLTRSYILYLGLKTAVTFIRNLWIYFYSKKRYPYLKDKSGQLSSDYRSSLIKNVKALFVIKVSSFIVNGTDNILLSSFVSLTSVAVYANYLLIISFLNKLFNMVFDKARASVGNFIVKESPENSYTLFKNIFFINFILTTYTSVGLFIVVNEVIKVWLGEEFIWASLVVAVLAFNNYSRYILQTCECFRGAVGLYSPRPFVKFLALFEGIVNLLFSLMFIYLFENDVLAVFLGTSVSTLCSTIAVPWIVYHFLFHRRLGEFFKLYFSYMLVGFLSAGVALVLCRVLYGSNPILNVVLGILICTVTLFCFVSAFYFRKEEFHYFVTLIRRFVPIKK